MKKLVTFFVVILLASCSKQDSIGSNSSNAMEPSHLLAQEIESINQELSSQVQYKISNEDLALLKDEEVLSEEELKELAKFAN